MIGIVGNGFVGNAVYQNFRDKTQCKVKGIGYFTIPFLFLGFAEVGSFVCI